jgi:prophage regulatory protein
MEKPNQTTKPAPGRLLRLDATENHANSQKCSPVSLTSEHQGVDIRGLINSEGTQMEKPNQTTKPAPGRLLRLDAVENLTGLRKSSIYTYMANKTHGFPGPLRIGARAVAWRESDVLAWIAGRTEARTQGGDK